MAVSITMIIVADLFMIIPTIVLAIILFFLRKFYISTAKAIREFEIAGMIFSLCYHYW